MTLECLSECHPVISQRISLLQEISQLTWKEDGREIGQTQQTHRKND